MSVPFCKGIITLLGIPGNIFVTSIVNVTIMLRISALYKYDRKVAIFLAFLFVGEFVAELYPVITVVLDKAVSNVYRLPAGFPVT